MEQDRLSQLPGALLPWYQENRRNLPWRQDREPYHVWLSEIMLQQTRVEAVKGYYARFLAALPTIADLAVCDDEVIHKLWEGLGYYSRVRNLKKCAEMLMSRFGGSFPQNYEEVLKLPGIGPYTAGAICSICFDAPTPAVDGNVLRVITRLTGDDTPIDSAAFQARVRQALAQIYPAQAGDFTQALMELGATVCGPNRRPDCENCPCWNFCKSAAKGNPERYPAKAPKKSRRVEQMTLFILSCDRKYALVKRPNKGLLAGLWEFPNTVGHLSVPEAISYLETLRLSIREVKRQLRRSHIFTHIQWDMQGVYLEVTQPIAGFTWLTPEEIDRNTALPTAFRQFWEEERYV